MTNDEKIADFRRRGVSFVVHEGEVISYVQLLGIQQAERLRFAEVSDNDIRDAARDGPEPGDGA